MALPANAGGNENDDGDSVLDIVVRHPQKVNLDCSRILGNRIIEEKEEDYYSCGSPDDQNDRFWFLGNSAHEGEYHRQRLDGSCIDDVGIYNRVCAISAKKEKVRHHKNA